MNFRLVQLYDRAKKTEYINLHPSYRDNLSSRLKDLQSTSLKIRSELSKELRTDTESSNSKDAAESIEDNRNIIQHIYNLIEEFDKVLVKQKLNLNKIISEAELERILPSFNGTTLPLFETFITEFEGVCNLRGLPTLARKPYLLKCMRGKAQSILHTLHLHEEKDYDTLVSMLSAFYNDTNKQRKLLLELQAEIDPIRSISREETSKLEGFIFFSKQKKILAAAHSLQNIYDNGKMHESPINHEFVTALEKPFPRTVTLKLFDKNYQSLSSIQRLNSLLDVCEQFKSLFWQEVITTEDHIPIYTAGVIPNTTPFKKKRLRRKRQNYNLQFEISKKRLTKLSPSQSDSTLRIRREEIHTGGSNGLYNFEPNNSLSHCNVAVKLHSVNCIPQINETAKSSKKRVRRKRNNISPPMLRNLIQGSCASHNHDRVASMNDNESDSKPEIADEKGIKSSKPYHEPKFCSKERNNPNPQVCTSSIKGLEAGMSPMFLLMLSCLLAIRKL